MFTLRGPVAGSFQHTVWPRGRASEAAILVSRAFEFLFSWYKVIIAISLCFSSGALQHTVHTAIIVAKIVSLNFFFSSSNISLRTWGTLRLARTKAVIPIWSVQNADCRLQLYYGGRGLSPKILQFFSDWIKNKRKNKSKLKGKWNVTAKQRKKNDWK